MNIKKLKKEYFAELDKISTQIKEIEEELTGIAITFELSIGDQGILGWRPVRQADKYVYRFCFTGFPIDWKPLIVCSVECRINCYDHFKEFEEKFNLFFIEKIQQITNKNLEK